MNIWLNDRSTINDSIFELYVIDKIGVVDPSRFIILNSIDECPNTRALALVTQETPKSVDRFYTIISPKRLKNISAQSLYLIPHLGRLWFYYHIPFEEDDDFSYCEQIFNHDSFPYIYSSQMFNNLMKMLISGPSSTEVIRDIINLGYVKNSDDEFHIMNVTATDLDLFHNGKFLMKIPNYFHHFNGPVELYSEKSQIKIDAKMCELLFLWLFFSDGVPYIQDKKYFFVNSGIFNSKNSITLGNWPADAQDCVFIQSLLTPTIDSYKLFCKFSYTGRYVKTYVSSMRYITSRSVSSNMTDLIETNPIIRAQSVIKPWEIAIIYRKFSENDHEMMNFMNFGSIAYERFLYKSYNDKTIPSVDEMKAIEMIFSTNGMNWTMEKNLYKKIASFYSKTLECFGTSQNHVLDDYCEPFNRSFFSMSHKAIADYDALIINPPYTEYPFIKTINHMFRYIFREKKISIFLFLPLWYDMNRHKKLSIPYRRSYHFPRSQAYDLKHQRKIIGVSSQLFFISNQELTVDDKNCLLSIIRVMKDLGHGKS